MQVEVRAHARLHFGFLDLSEEKRRRFGGMGVSITKPRFVLRMEPARRLEVTGEQADRIDRLVARFHDALDLQSEARIRVVEAIPEHVGLGSGTQLALAVAAGLARLHGLDLPPEELCSVMGRAHRSGVGYHAFQRGGFVVEGGHATDPRPTLGGTPPLLLRHEFPEDWRILVAIPRPSETVSGEAEEKAFARLRPASEQTVAQIAHIVLMRLLPSLVERDLVSFGAALTEAQELVGSCFESVQEGLFHPGGVGLIARLKEAGAQGVGQSSWGPAIYAFAADQAEEERLLGVAREADPGAMTYTVRGCNRGAAIEST
jgi:beta-ribofuranosylaminobenzene 5'-phosphate synthase